MFWKPHKFNVAVCGQSFAHNVQILCSFWIVNLCLTGGRWIKPEGYIDLNRCSFVTLVMYRWIMHDLTLKSINKFCLFVLYSQILNSKSFCREFATKLRIYNKVP